MNNKKKLVKFIIAFIIAGLIFSLHYFLTAPSDNPETAIKKYVFYNGNPIESFDLSIRSTDIFNGPSIQQYVVEGYKGNETRMEIRFFWLEKTGEGWIVLGAGTGP